MPEFALHACHASHPMGRPILIAVELKSEQELEACADAGLESLLPDHSPVHYASHCIIADRHRVIHV